MKSSELRRRLKELELLHGDQEVITEGCDCVGDSGNVVYDDEGVFYILRKTEAQELNTYILPWRSDEELRQRYPGMLPDD